MGTTFQVVGQKGHGCSSLGKNLRVSVLGGPDVWVGDVGDKTTHWEGFGRITPQGGQQGQTDKIQSPSGCNHLWIWELVFYNVLCTKLTPDISYYPGKT